MGPINPTIGLMTIPYYMENNGSLDPGTLQQNAPWYW